MDYVNYSKKLFQFDDKREEDGVLTYPLTTEGKIVNTNNGANNFVVGMSRRNKFESIRNA